MNECVCNFLSVDFYYCLMMSLPYDSIAPGMLLVSDPFLQDNHFERSVILVCDHNEEGTFGFCINKKSEYSLGDLLDESSEVEIPVYLGGPVEQNTLHFIHHAGEAIENAIALGNGIFWGGDFEQVKLRIASGIDQAEDYKFFLGYSGWGPSQLKNEIESDTWLIFEAKNEWVFQTEADSIWKTILIQQGGIFAQMANYPKDPRLN